MGSNKIGLSEEVIDAEKSAYACMAAGAICGDGDCRPIGG
jgi:hypothetical protein